jgi:hypothetical protein
MTTVGKTRNPIAPRPKCTTNPTWTVSDDQQFWAGSERFEGAQENGTCSVLPIHCC